MNPLQPSVVRLVRPRWLVASLFAHVAAFALVQGPAPMKAPKARLEVHMAARALPRPAPPMPITAGRPTETKTTPPAPVLARHEPAPTPSNTVTAMRESAAPALAAPPAQSAPVMPAAAPVYRVPAPVPPAPAPVAEDALAGYSAAFSRWLAQHKSYPRLAQMRGWQGQVKLRVRVARKGAVMDVEITHSSGFDILDKEAQALVRRADPLPELPLSLAEREFTLEIPVVFRLEQAS